MRDTVYCYQNSYLYHQYFNISLHHQNCVYEFELIFLSTSLLLLLFENVWNIMALKENTQCFRAVLVRYVFYAT